MIPSLRLLLGQATDADYFAHLEAERRGLRFEVARPGWSNRWALAIRAIAGLFGFGVIVVAFILLALLFLAGPRP